MELSESELLKLFAPFVKKGITLKCAVCGHTPLIPISHDFQLPTFDKNGDSYVIDLKQFKTTKLLALECPECSHMMFFNKESLGE